MTAQFATKADTALASDNPHYQMIGGEPVIRRLVDRFYTIMDSDPQMAVIRGMHADDLTHAKEKLVTFLSGWPGGPKLYEQRHGPPRLRRAHMEFPIGEAERDQWMACMTRAMADVGVAEDLRATLTASFLKVADFLRNK